MSDEERVLKDAAAKIAKDRKGKNVTRALVISLQIYRFHSTFLSVKCRTKSILFCVFSTAWIEGLQYSFNLGNIFIVRMLANPHTYYT